MTNKVRISVAQMNPVVGDLDGNAALILENHARAKEAGADVLVTTELSVSGYPPEDLVLRPAYVEACMAAVHQLAQATEGGPSLIVGSPWYDEGQRVGQPYNAAILLKDGEVAGVSRKVCLPNYGPFDEPRTFKPATRPQPLDCGGIKLGLMICEDMWFPDVTDALCKDGADVLIVPHGSPFRTGVHDERLAEAMARHQETGRPLIFANQWGGQDELVFDGGCFAVSGGAVVGRLPLFEAGMMILDAVEGEAGWSFEAGDVAAWPVGEAMVYEALVTGTRDYVQKSGFRDVVIGLSGGIDSALVAAVAVDALGAEHVHCIRLPSRYTSEGSMVDAEACAQALGVRLDTVGIEPGVAAFDEMLASLFEGTAPGITEENLQSRIRGTALMALSNKFGSLMLTTGNKSEMAVGYATLYGDMNGAYNPLKDVYKTEVYRLARWRNSAKPSWALGPGGEVIPEVIITKPPSAELREDQKDEDSLPPYEVLDRVLEGLIEKEESVDEIVASGVDRAIVTRVQTLLYRAEYKRRQSAPGPKVTRRYFGRDRRYPIVNRFSG